MDLGELLLNQKIGLFGSYDKHKEYTEVLANGVFKVYNNDYFSVRHKVCDLSGLVGSIPSGTSSITTVRTIPYKYLQMVMDFYRDVNEIYGTEASVIFYYNYANKEIPKKYVNYYGSRLIIEDKLVIVVPDQENTGVHSSFNVDAEFITYLEDNLLGILETHSHNTMPAFWSGEDDRNERGTIARWYMVMGKVANDIPMFRVRFNYNGHFLLDRKLSEVFELTMDFELTELYTGNPCTVNQETFKYANKGSYPKEWLEALK